MHHLTARIFAAMRHAFALVRPTRNAIAESLATSSFEDTQPFAMTAEATEPAAVTPPVDGSTRDKAAVALQAPVENADAGLPNIDWAVALERFFPPEGEQREKRLGYLQRLAAGLGARNKPEVLATYVALVPDWYRMRPNAASALLRHVAWAKCTAGALSPHFERVCEFVRLGRRLPVGFINWQRLEEAAVTNACGGLVDAQQEGHMRAPQLGLHAYRERSSSCAAF